MAEELQDAPWLNDLPDAPWAAKPSIAADIAKSGGIGLVRGGIGLAGAPGDITTGLSGGSDWLRSKLVDYGLLSPERAERARKAEAASNQQMTLPTSQGIRGAIEQRTGPFYEPKTRAGRYAESAGEFVPGAMLGGGDLLTNAVRFGVLPGLASHGAQEATQGTGLEPYAQAAAALGVGGIGALATQPRTAERFLRAQLPDYVTQQSINDADSLIRDANARGVNLTWPEALSQVTGQPVLNDMQRILEGSKQTRATMQQTLGDRPAEIAQAGGNIAAGIAPRNWEPSTIGGQVGQAAEAVTNEAREAINKLSEPYYKRAENVRISPQQMQQVQALPGWDEAVKAVRGDPQLNRYVATLPANSVGFLNEVKKYLDQQAENAASPLYQQRNMQRSAGYGRDAAAVRGIGVNASVDYATALAVQAHSRETYLDPLMRGPLGQLAKKNNTTKQAIDALFPSQPLAGSANEVRTAVQELSGQNPDIARQLVRAHVEAKLNEAFDAAGRSPEAAGFAGATFAQRISGNPLIETVS
jgi:hypothetical protein